MAQSKELKNLLRRIKRFNLANPSNALNIESAKGATTPHKLGVVVARLEKAKELAQTQRNIVRTANATRELKYKGHVYETATKTKIKPVKYKVPKTLKAAQKELARLTAEKLAASTFNLRQNRFIRKVKAYNKTLTLKENSKRYIYLPRNERELEQHERALKLVKRGDIAGAKKVLKIKSEKKTIREALLVRDSRSAKKTGGFTYNDRLFLFQSIENARTSPVPELADLFRQGGESLILELEHSGFTMIEYYDPDMDMDDVGSHILDQLEDTIEELNGRNQILVREFISRVRGRYE